MDRALKERIVGAIVLVAVIVLVVPVFLDGPSNNGEVISERVPLPGQEEQPMQTVVLDRDRDEPVPAPVAATPSAEETADRSAESAPIVLDDVSNDVSEAAASEASVEEAPPPIIEPVAEPVVEDEQIRTDEPAVVASAASSTGMWAVQIGSYSSKENAENQAADLRRQGFAAFLSQHSGATGPLHRVRVGPQRDREEAEAMAERLGSAGHTGQVVPHP